MASLTHVHIWDDKDWRLITAKEAALLHPGGTVSARSGLFMCALCHQYVTLTDGQIMDRYFKHSAYEKSKDCPERTFGSSYSVNYKSGDHNLPIRITSVSSSSFRFEIGMIRAPISSLSKEFKLRIQPKGVNNKAFVFSKERLNFDSITYLSIGEQPYENYTISFLNGFDKLFDFWPKVVKGIDSDGTLFEKSTGKMLNYDSDVEINKEYYLLMRNSLNNIKSKSCMRIQKITQKKINKDVWNLYSVTCTAYEEVSAKFFLNFHCRLTDHPVSLQPVWPVFVEDSLVVKHNQDSMYILVSGNATSVHTFPTAAVRSFTFNSSQSKLYEIRCSSRQQLISTGRTQALQYTFFWKEQLVKENSLNEVIITDLTGVDLPCGEINELPLEKTIRIKLPFDGEIIVVQNNREVDKRKVDAVRAVELSNLKYGLTVQIYIGLDCVWQAIFKKKQESNRNDEEILLKQIVHASGVYIPIPHSLRNIMNGMRQYPHIISWIKGCIMEGQIREQAFRRLQEMYRSININRQGDKL
ncbi:hypothetical protein SDC9_66437 [bioreactor metagenome]|uniref:Uncharacterized protein n=1 Tax=bioreactor metagenome TaxID=1076179 RepID=A0A644XUW8_9ZZZZ